MGLLDGKRILVTGILTDASLAFGVARLAQEQGAEIVLTGAGRGLRLTERTARNVGRGPKPNFDAEAWLTRHPEVYTSFRAFTLEAINRGVNRLGAKAVAERVRWETMVSGGADFRVNNNAVAAMARKFMAEYPQYPVFTTRNQTKKA